MDFLALARARRSVRSYRSDPVSPKALERCLEAARLSPSACNAQPWHFVVATEPALCRELADAMTSMGMNGFAKQAPALIALVQERPNISSRFGGLVKGKVYADMDCGIAAAHFCLQAASDGLGTCIIGWFDEKRVARALGVPKGKRIPLIITLGHPQNESGRPKARKALGDMSSNSRYSG